MRPFAIFTVVQNGHEFLQAWLGYYCQRVPPEDIYVLDHDSNGVDADAVTEACMSAGVHLLPVDHEFAYDDQWLMTVTRGFQHYLLASYDCVMFSAADELIVPSDGTLESYVRTFAELPVEAAWPARAAVAQGWEIVHQRDQEDPIDWTRALLRQRTKMYPCKRYSRPVLAKHPLFWNEGWTWASNVPPKIEPSPGLLLLHLHKIDYDYCLTVHRERAARRWKPEERKTGLFRHNLIDDPELLSRWLLANTDKPGEYAQFQDIPSNLKELF